MNRDEILSLAGMPPGNPSYPHGPYRFINRQYFNVISEPDPDAIPAMVPEPLEPDGSGTVVYEWIGIPDSSGFGAYQESGIGIPCLLDGQAVNCTAMMFLDIEPPITAGREIRGFPKPWGQPDLRVEKVPHVNAPVRRVIEGQHIIADLSLPYGRVVHDYLA